MTNNLLLKDNKLISSSDVLYKWSAGNKLARAYSTGVWNKPEVGGRLSEIGLYPRVFDTYKWLVDNNLYDKFVFGINRQAGFLPNEITGADHLHTAYDLSKYENDAEQTTAADQPKIVSKGWEFDGESDRLVVAHDNSLNLGLDNIVIAGWLYPYTLNPDTITDEVLISKTQNVDNRWYFRIRRADFVQVFANAGGVTEAVASYSFSATSNYIKKNEWNYIIIHIDRANEKVTPYLFRKDANFSFEQSADFSSNVDISNTGDVTVGSYLSQWHYNGQMTDLFYVKNAPVQPFIDYYNLTKHKYGH